MMFETSTQHLKTGRESPFPDTNQPVSTFTKLEDQSNFLNEDSVFFPDQLDASSKTVV